MRRTHLALVIPALFAACASGPPQAKIEGGYRPIDRIPVDDPKTPFVTAALFEPQGSGPFPAVILLGGCYGLSGDVSVVQRVNADYLPRGIATLVLDSFSMRGVPEVCSDAGAARRFVEIRVRDAYAAKAWLARRPEIDPGRIFLQGYSHGAVAAIAATDAQFPTTPSNGFSAVIAFYPYCYNRQIRFSVPTIVLAGGRDDWTPASSCEEIADRTNVEIIVYPHASHQFASPGTDLVYLGHRLQYDEAATNDAQHRALSLIESQLK